LAYTGLFLFSGLEILQKIKLIIGPTYVEAVGPVLLWRLGLLGVLTPNNFTTGLCSRANGRKS
jgi:hypothetical protein